MQDWSGQRTCIYTVMHHIPQRTVFKCIAEHEQCSNALNSMLFAKPISTHTHKRNLFQEEGKVAGTYVCQRLLCRAACRTCMWRSLNCEDSSTCSVWVRSGAEPTCAWRSVQEHALHVRHAQPLCQGVWQMPRLERPPKDLHELGV